MELTAEEMVEFTAVLRDTPETVLALHALHRQTCRAFLAGGLHKFKALLVQFDYPKTEPQAFGSNPEAIWDLLQMIQGWDCVNVASEVAPLLGELIQKRMNVAVRYYDDFYYTLAVAVKRYHHECVRRLRLVDTELLESAPKEFRGHGYGTPRELIEEGVVACGVVSGQVVSIAHTAGHTKKFADIGVITRKDWRNKGLASAGASIVAGVLQEKGIIPVWSAGDDNFPSVRVAEKLGFSKVSKRQYIILEKSPSG